MGDGRGYFILDNVFREVGLVATRCLVPSLGTEVIAKLAHIPSASAVVATVDQAAVFVPLVYGDKKVFFAEGDHYIVIIQPYFRGDRTDIGKEGGEVGDDIISFPFPELVPED